MAPVRSLRVAVVAGLLVALYVIAAYTIKTVPDWAIGAFGGPSRSIDRLGGLRVHFRPAPGTEHAFEAYLAEHGATVSKQGGLFVLEMAGLPEAAAHETLDLLESGGLVMKEALDDVDYAAQIGESEGVTIEVDRWRPEEVDKTYTTTYLRATSASAMQHAIDAASARDFRLPPGTELVFETVERYDSKDPRAYLRSYLVKSAVAIDGTMIASAYRSYDPNTGRPVVLIDFTREGGRVFCDLTARIVGHKLVTITGGRVASAPIINSRICGGRASVTMGGSDPMRQEREADALVAVLQAGALPAGGTIEKQDWQPPANVTTQEWLARIAFGLVAGLGLALIVFFTIRFARPSTSRSDRPAGTFPWRRLIVTALAPLALYLGAKVTLPAINEVELAHITRGEIGVNGSVIALGVTPIMTAFALVELVALCIPRLRWRRHDPVGRIRLGQAVAVLAVVLACVQAYFIATYFESIGRGPFARFGFGGGVEVATMSGWGFRLLVMVTLAAGTCLLAIVAGMIREHGLGNGYAALLASGVVMELVDPEKLSYWASRSGVVALVGVLTLAVATRAVLRWRIAGGEREPALRMPTCGATPLVDSVAMIVVVLTLVSLAAGTELFEAMDLMRRLSANLAFGIVVLLATIPVWAWLFARPALVDRVALQAGLDRPTTRTWMRGTLVSLLLVGGAGLLGLHMVRVDHTAWSFAKPFEIMIATAAALDIVDDLRARRRKLVPAGVIHQVQYLGVVERVLADAGIPAHFHASNVRTLAAFFGPWAPVVVLVPEEHGEAARARLDDVLRSSRVRVPAARIADAA